jgi:hypothetical protein
MEQLRIENEIQLEDLIAFYPLSETKEIQKLLTAKKEMNELKSREYEEVPEKGDYFKHQKLVQRLMVALDKLFIVHQPGTGKTCAFIASSEYYKNIAEQMENTRIDLLNLGKPVKMVYVLVKNKTLKDEFLNQLVCSCTHQKYEDDKKQMNMEKIKKWYTVLTYSEFGNKIEKYESTEEYKRVGKKMVKQKKAVSVLSDEQIREEFSNCLFFVDEVHNLRLSNITDAEALEEGEDIPLKNYDRIWKVFHTAYNLKIILASATPMVNSPVEISQLLNLILDKDKQVSKNTDFSKLSVKEFEKIARGKFSYVRTLDTGIDIIDEGDEIEGTLIVNDEEINISTKVVQSYMGDCQIHGYIKEQTKYRDKDEIQESPEDVEERPLVEEEDQNKSRLYRGLMEASMFVFPKYINDNNCENYLLGTEGFKKYIKYNDKKGYYFDKSFQEIINDTNDLRRFGSKFATIIELISSTPGNTFIYTEFKTIGSNLLGACINSLLDYQLFNEELSVFRATETFSTSYGGICIKKDDRGKRKLTIDKANRYAIISGDTPSQVTRNILDLFNSEENMDGEYLKVVIATRKAREGINLENVVNIHLLDASWNKSSEQQAMYRGIRTTSHVSLLKRLQQKLDDEYGIGTKKARIDVRIYRHASVYPVEELEDGTFDYSKLARDLARKNAVKLDNLIDIKMYQNSELKDRKIGIVMRMIKEVSVDCQINYNRNYRVTDKDNSMDCNYTKCEYRCFDEEPGWIDYSTFDVYYTKEIINLVIETIKKLFRKSDIYYFEEVNNEIKSLPKKFVLQGLSEVIRERIVIYNRYGFPCFLQEEGDRYFLISEIDFYSNIKPNLLLSKYTTDIYGIHKINLVDLTNMIRQTKKSDISNEDVKFILETIEENKNYYKLINVVENILIKKSNNELLSKDEQDVLKKYKNFIFKYPEPITLIKAEEDKKYAKPTGKKGRPKNIAIETKIKKYKYGDFDINDLLKNDNGNQDVWVHILNLFNIDKVKYDVTAKYFKADTKIRIMKKNENIWKDVNEFENIVYNLLLQTTLNDMIVNFFPENYKYYGTVMVDNQFRIIDKTKESEKAKDNLHFSKRGATCTDLHVNQIVIILSNLNIEPKDLQKYNFIPQYPLSSDEIEKAKIKIKGDKTKVEQKDIDNLNEKQIWIAYAWLLIHEKNKSKNKEYLCDIILDYMDDKDLIFRVTQNI